MTNNSSDSLIGLMADQHPGLLAGMLGILKSGSGFVPIDPDYPDDRITYMMNDCRVEILVTEAKYLPKVSAIAASSAFLRHIICLDSVQEDVTLPEGITLHNLSDTIAGVSIPGLSGHRSSVAGPLLPAIDPDQLAYVIYTSGSTGVPKGVPIRHRNLMPLLYWSQEYFNFGEHTNVLQNLNVCFDFGVFELLTTLLFGGTLHFLDKNELTDFAEYGAYINDRGINTFHTTPSFFRSILLYCDKLPNLEVLHLGGEALTESIVNEIFARVGDKCVIYNGYGPTEASVNCSIFTVGNKAAWQDKPLANVPIGRASANNFLYVLDERGEPVPAYVPGELVVGGVALSQGYLNRPELTAEKFVPNPFSQDPGARLYRTGDLVRYLPDGNIEFLGRIDYQVKVRGFRIELGEIEAALEQHPGVRETVVLAREDIPNQKRLVAYLVAGQESTPTVSELHTFLQQRLPEYMLPAAYVFLDALPLNPNGKVDRKALPVPDQIRPELATTFVAPQTPTEQILADIWRRVLGLEQVGTEDNFFELGGDSMRIIQVTAEANKAGVELRPAQVFQRPTIAGLAKVATAPAAAAAAAPAEQGVVTGPVPLTPIQHFFFEHVTADPHHWNWSFLREVPTALNPPVLKQAFGRLLAHHDALRLRFQQTSSGWQQINTGVEDAVPFSVVDLSSLDSEAQRAALEMAAARLQASLNLSEGPLVRVTYFDLGAHQSARMLIIFHHLVVDVISTRILMEDFQTAFHHLSQGQPVQLPPKTTSFQTWSRRLSAYAQTAELQQELAYWVDTLGGSVSSLPLDYPGGLNSEPSAGLVVKSLGTVETRALLQEMPAITGARIHEVLLMALASTFARWTGEPALLVDMEGHGREYIIDDVDLSRTVGWFTSVYPVRLDLSLASEKQQVLPAVQTQLRRVPNRGIGYGLLRYLCHDESVRQQIRALPPAEVSFNYLGQLDQQLSQATPFKTARENRGPERSLRGSRGYPLYIVGSVRNGILRLHWNYSRNLHRRATIERLAEDFCEDLHSLISPCISASSLCISV